MSSAPRVGTERQRVIRDLRALVAAIDSRVPHLERAGERQIALDAAALREKAVRLLEELDVSSD